MSESISLIALAVLVAAAIGLAVYRAGQASGREQHRAEARKVWQARMKGDDRPAREILSKEGQAAIMLRERRDLYEQRLRHLENSSDHDGHDR